MSTLGLLVVGVDGSAASKAALAWAAHSVDPDGTVFAVHAAGERTAFDPRWVEGIEADRCTVATHLVDDEPAGALLAVADRENADAIVVGPHSGDRNRQTLGSVTRRLLQQSSIPVIVAKDGPSDRAGTVVACVGYGDATEQAAAWAAGYAANHGFDLELLHVVGYRPIFPADSPSDMLASYFGPETLRRWAQEDVEEIRARLSRGQPNLPITATVDVGFASKAIVAASVGVELVVVGKRTENLALRSLISPRIHLLIAKAATSVAVVPSCSIEP